jgi:hypothetical protein
MGHRVASPSGNMAGSDFLTASRKSAAFEALLAARKMARLSERRTLSNQQQIIM